MRLYYLSPAAFALSNIALRRLKISRFADLNDPFELLAANLENSIHRKAFADLKQKLNETRGLICFSKSWDNPLLWGHYAEKHTGIALGFEISDKLAVKVVYKSRRVKLQVAPKTKAIQLDEEKVRELLSTKFKDWEYEHEYRVFVQLDLATREAGAFFKDFSEDLSLMEVVLGPRCELPIERVRQLIETSYPKVIVRKARMGFREFRVVEDRASRRRPNDELLDLS